MKVSSLKSVHYRQYHFSWWSSWNQKNMGKKKFAFTHTLLGWCPKNSARNSKGLIISSPVCFSIPRYKCISLGNYTVHFFRLGPMVCKWSDWSLIFPFAPLASPFFFISASLFWRSLLSLFQLWIKIILSCLLFTKNFDFLLRKEWMEKCVSPLCSSCYFIVQLQKI